MVAAMRESFKTVENRCMVCGKPIHGLPFKIRNLLCKRCYGMDHYRRQRVDESSELGSIKAYAIAARRVA